MASKKKPNRPRPGGAARTSRPTGGAAPAGARTAPRPKPGTTKAGTTKAGTTNAGTTNAGTTKARAATTKAGPTKAERLALAEAARRKKAARVRGLIIAAGAALVIVLALVLVSNKKATDKTTAHLEAGSCKADSESDADLGAGRNHQAGTIAYKVNPPAGGNHNPSPSAPGIYEAGSLPPDGEVVHALEHGYVAVWYKPTLDAAAVSSLRDLANRYPRDVLLMPRASLAQPVAATAWHRRLLCGQTDLDALDLFVRTYRNAGPEKIPH